MELIVRWLAFVWGAGRAGNPLLEGYGVPSSAMRKSSSALSDTTAPGLESRSSCPEAIWQAASGGIIIMIKREEPTTLCPSGGQSAYSIVDTRRRKMGGPPTQTTPPFPFRSPDRRNG